MIQRISKSALTSLTKPAISPSPSCLNYKIDAFLLLQQNIYLCGLEMWVNKYKAEKWISHWSVVIILWKSKKPNYPWFLLKELDCTSPCVEGNSELKLSRHTWLWSCTRILILLSLNQLSLILMFLKCWWLVEEMVHILLWRGNNVNNDTVNAWACRTTSSLRTWQQQHLSCFFHSWIGNK